MRNKKLTCSLCRHKNRRVRECEWQTIHWQYWVYLCEFEFKLIIINLYDSHNSNTRNMTLTLFRIIFFFFHRNWFSYFQLLLTFFNIRHDTYWVRSWGDRKKSSFYGVRCAAAHQTDAVMCGNFSYCFPSRSLSTGIARTFALAPHRTIDEIIKVQNPNAKSEMFRGIIIHLNDM